MPSLLGRLVARAKPVVPDRAWPTLLTVRSTVAALRDPGQPIIGLPAFGRVLVVIAHPDDEGSCAGTLALLSDSGTTVEILAATDGEATIGSPHPSEETARLRRQELEESAAVLGATASFAHLPDGDLPGREPEIAAAIQEAIDRVDPEAVFVPWLADGHDDHQAVARALAACRLRPETQLWGFETWTTLPHNRLVDVTATVERKEQAIRAHRTAALAFDLTTGLGLSRWRSMHGLLGVGHGEAFLATSVDDYRRLAEELYA